MALLDYRQMKLLLILPLIVMSGFIHSKEMAKIKVIPRFASLRSNAANLHVGPGTNYPIEWKFTRQNLPVEIISEFDNWRKVRDHQGSVGWLHKSLLSGKRSIIVINGLQDMYAKPDQNSNITAKLEPGVVLTVLEIQSNWCKVEIRSEKYGSHKGWVMRQNLWGIYEGENSLK